MWKKLLLGLFVILFLSVELQSYEFKSWNKLDFKKDAMINYTYFNLNRFNQPLLANVLYYGNTKTDLELYTFNEDNQSFTLTKYFPKIDPQIKDSGIYRVETDIEGNLWILSGGKIYSENQGIFSVYPLPHIFGDAVSYVVSELFIDYSGVIWFLLNTGQYYTEGSTEIFKIIFKDWFTIQNKEVVHISNINLTDATSVVLAQGFQRINRLFQDPYTHKIYGIDQFSMFSNGYTGNGMYEVNLDGIVKTFPIRRHTLLSPSLKGNVPLNINHVEFNQDGKKIIYAFDKVSLGGYYGGVSLYNTQDKTWEIIEENPTFNYEQMEMDYGSRYQAARYVEGSLWIFNFWGWIEIFNGKEVKIMKTIDFLTHNYAPENPQIFNLFTQNSNTFWLKTAYWDVIRIEANESGVSDERQSTIRCYPVPAKIGEDITIELGENSFITSFELMDYLGKILERKDITFEDKITISSNRLSAGCYFIVLQTKDNQQIPIKIIIK